MYVAGLAGSLKHVRHVIHKALPRELSPSDQIKRWAIRQQRKGQAKVAKVQTDSDARQAKAQAAFDAQMRTLKSLTPEMLTPGDPLTAITSAPKTPPRAAARPAPNYVPYIAGGAALLFLAMAMAKGKRR